PWRAGPTRVLGREVAAVEERGPDAGGEGQVAEVVVDAGEDAAARRGLEHRTVEELVDEEGREHEERGRGHRGSRRMSQRGRRLLARAPRVLLYRPRTSTPLEQEQGHGRDPDRGDGHR